MNLMSRQIVFREVPDEISLSYLIAGCSLRCPGCHSSDSWNAKAGKELTTDLFLADLHKYRQSITCVLFLGGEWNQSKLIELLKIAQAQGLKTCLYTGLNEIPPELKAHLNYVKLGPYVEALGGLDSPITNQQFINLDNNICMNHIFQTTGGDIHDQTNGRTA